MTDINLTGSSSNNDPTKQPAGNNNQTPGSEVNKEPTPGSAGNNNQTPGSEVNKAQTPGSEVNKAQTPGSEVNKAQTPESVVNKEPNTGSAGNNNQTPGSVVNKDPTKQPAGNNQPTSGSENSSKIKDGGNHYILSFGGGKNLENADFQSLIQNKTTHIYNETTADFCKFIVELTKSSSDDQDPNDLPDFWADFI